MRFIEGNTIPFSDRVSPFNCDHSKMFTSFKQETISYQLDGAKDFQNISEQKKLRISYTVNYVIEIEEIEIKKQWLQ